MNKLTLFSMIIFLLVTSCSEDQTSPNNNANELLPLKIGNAWVRNITYYDEFLAENSGKVTYTVVSDEMYNGEKYYRMEMFNHKSNQKKILPHYLINKSDGIYSLTFDENNEPQAEFLKYPVSEGEVFNSNESRQFYVEKVDTLITTSAGKFKCIMYVYTHTLSNGKDIEKTITYYCPGVGLIAVENYILYQESGNQALFIKSELVSYKLK